MSSTRRGKGETNLHPSVLSTTPFAVRPLEFPRHLIIRTLLRQLRLNPHRQFNRLTAVVGYRAAFSISARNSSMRCQISACITGTASAFSVQHGIGPTILNCSINCEASGEHL